MEAAWPGQSRHMPEMPSLSHVALSVTDLSVSVPWYQALFDTEPAMTLTDGPFERRVFALADGQLFGLTAHEGARTGDRFDVVAPGLDHVGFRCTDRAEVAAWQTHLDHLGVDHGGIVEAEYGYALSCKDPDGNALEFFAMAQG
jgi:glyoxylase I family protein